MFYQTDIPAPAPGAPRASALVVLDPSESRRLIAKATAAIPEVKRALATGTIIIARGVTNAFVTEELLGVRVEPKSGLSVGTVCSGITTGHSGPPASTSHVIRHGKVVDGADASKEILSFGPDDVFIKGGNAIDAEGRAGILASGPTGGTIGMAWPVITARGSHLVMPIGLEKLIPSVVAAAERSGIYRFKWSMGLPARLIPIELGRVITEIQALAILAGVEVTPVAAGGIGGSEGAVVLSIEGEESRVERAFELVKSIKGEPAVPAPPSLFVRSAAEFDYEPMAQLATLVKR
jgi:hypothetical protein